MTALAAAMSVLAVVLLGGCASPSTGAGRAVSLVPTKVLLRDVVWATEVDALIGLTEDDRLVEIDPSTGETLHASQLESAGDNLAILTQPVERVFVPQPDLDRVAVVATDGLEHLRSLTVGKAPAWVAASAPAHTLFALSDRGTTVTGLDVETHDINVRQRVDAGHEGEVEDAEDSRDPAFWVVTPHKAAHFGNGYPPERTGLWEGPANTDAFGPDRDHAERAYMVEEGSSRVSALDGSDGDLTVVGARTVGATVDYLESRAKEEARVFAVTENRLVVLSSASLEVLGGESFRGALGRVGLSEANVSGMTVGDSHVYLTLSVEPRVVRIMKPSE